jgi:hypothetical protein
VRWKCEQSWFQTSCAIAEDWKESAMSSPCQRSMLIIAEFGPSRRKRCCGKMGISCATERVAGSSMTMREVPASERKTARPTMPGCHAPLSSSS